MNNRIATFLFILILFTSLSAFSQDAHENCDEDHSQPSAVAAASEEHEKHEGIQVTLSAAAQKMAGLTTAQVTTGQIKKTNELSGEIGFNEESLVHISPRFPGIAIETKCRLGSYVKAGDIVAIVESNESMNSYSIKAPISGWIIKKHITPGEYVSGETSIFVLADLSNVWVNLAVYPKDANRITPGQEVSIFAVGSDQNTKGTIDFITPMLDIHTRSSTARVILPNPGNLWRPGMFVNAQVITEETEPGLIVEKNAVQIVDEETVVFIVEGPDQFVAVNVVVGDADAQYIKILSGLHHGTEYVAKGAFELKAQIVTSALGGHAGHGH